MKKLLWIFLSLLLTACQGDDQYFWTKLKVMPPETTSEGTQTGVEAELHVGQYSRYHTEV